MNVDLESEAYLLDHAIERSRRRVEVACLEGDTQRFKAEDMELKDLYFRRHLCAEQIALKETALARAGVRVSGK